MVIKVRVLLRVGETNDVKSSSLIFTLLSKLLCLKVRETEQNLILVKSTTQIVEYRGLDSKTLLLSLVWTYLKHFPKSLL